ncbi:hypothetical protein G6F24_016361 [Rhizopus arrhizus]|nr:hypothetical protein G6F24_016361 [Rhizopus arrhizus]
MAEAGGQAADQHAQRNADEADQRRDPQALEQHGDGFPDDGEINGHGAASSTRAARTALRRPTGRTE